jgi:2-dehydropantoate 2-reductase
LVLGPGALGRALGETLRAGGAQVTYFGRQGPEGPCDGVEVVLVTVKAGETAAAIAAAKAVIPPGAAIVSLQNGLGNVEKIAAAFGAHRTFGGSTTHGARRLASGEVLHTARGETRIAPLERSAFGRGREVAEMLTASGLPTSCSDDLAELLWRKLAISCGINAVTGILGCENGAILRSEAARTLVVEAAREVARVAERYGVSMDGDPAVRALDVAQRTGRNKSSLLQDLERGRETEVRFLNGAAIERGAQVGVKLPVNEVLLMLVRAREELGA